jgi:predicted aconitase with swiveling domain
MADMVFEGRPVISGTAEDLAEVSRVGFDTCAIYADVLVVGADTGICRDRNNKELYGHNLRGKILCIPQTVGSSNATTLFTTLLEKGIAPGALCLANHIDAAAADGLILANRWFGRRIVTVDLLGCEFLAAVKTGDLVKVYKSGKVEIDPCSA